MPTVVLLQTVWASLQLSLVQSAGVKGALFAVGRESKIGRGEKRGRDGKGIDALEYI